MVMNLEDLYERKIFLAEKIDNFFGDDDPCHHTGDRSYQNLLEEFDGVIQQIIDLEEAEQQDLSLILILEKVRDGLLPVDHALEILAPLMVEKFPGRPYVEVDREVRTPTKEIQVYMVAQFGDHVTVEDVEEWDDLDWYCTSNNYTKEFVFQTMKEFIQNK
jgi:hypothetical protein